LIRAAAVALAISALGSRAETGRSRVSTASVLEGAPDDGPTAGLSALFPPGSLPDAEVCIPFPLDDDLGGDELSAFEGAHHDKRGRFRTYEQIPRRPDRPS